MLLAHRFDRHVRPPTIEDLQRVPVPGVHGIGMRPGLFIGVLAREVDLRPQALPLPGRQRKVHSLFERQASRIQVMVEGFGDGRYAEGRGRQGDLRDGRDPLVAF